MSIDQLNNCINCGRLFVKNVSNICPRCVEDINQQYERCTEYIKENRACTIYELSEETDVSVRQITQFIHEGRILIGELVNLGYPCNSCGQLIKVGKICDNCSLRIAREVRDVTSRNAEEEQEEAKASYLHKNSNMKKKL
ncbi:flagellar protein [Chengkuizengella sp. SCS-71B]|uniref:flagellar protein n=1 Tax=Chengkuizengella sp. SCS-71B TaxID=3115290 RepID=UPI0032C24894